MATTPSPKRPAPEVPGSPKLQAKKAKLGIDQECIQAIRLLAPVLPQEANSGHPGAPMGLAAVAHALWGHVMKLAPEDRHWLNRDRFVLSNGHACALHYVMNYLIGLMTLDDLKQFRKWGSNTPGHPERGCPGIEVTTGPLGQGIAQAVGLAIASELHKAVFNKPDLSLFNNHTFCIVGDGCLQEGVSAEAASLAGHLGLGSLIVIFDDNGITIDGPTTLSYSTEDVLQRFEAYGWHTSFISAGESDSVDAIVQAIRVAMKVTDKPSIIKVKTIIGHGSNKAGSEKAHGSPLGWPEIKRMRKEAGYDEEQPWQIPQSVIEHYKDSVVAGSNKSYHEWKDLLAQYAKKYPEDYAQLQTWYGPALNEMDKAVDKWDSHLANQSAHLIKAIGDKIGFPFKSDGNPSLQSTTQQATREVSEKILQALFPLLTNFVGGSADLMDSNKTQLMAHDKNAAAKALDIVFSRKNRSGRYIHFGIREHAMFAAANGLRAYGGLWPFCATFLNFYTYGWGAVRLSALSHLGCLFLASHDSIDLGEDGPTHQPVEVHALIRSTPNILFMRPADGNELLGCYEQWMKHSRTTPSVICLSRGKHPVVHGTDAAKVEQGGYIIKAFEKNGKKKIVLGGSGTELHVAIQASQILAEEFDCQIVSMPCWELFEKLDLKKRLAIVPAKGGDVVARSYVEAFSSFGVGRYFDEDASWCMKTFGASASGQVCFEKFGFTGLSIADHIRRFVAQRG